MNKLLNATGEELSRLAGEVLNGTEHDLIETDIIFERVCTQCGKVGVLNSSRFKAPCTRPVAIPITWPEAMKWRDWAVKELGCVPLTRACLEVALTMGKCTYSEYTEGTSGTWHLFQEKVNMLDFVSFAQPEHYIKAAMICKKGESNDQ